jgi:hypothetical protein
LYKAPGWCGTRTQAVGSAHPGSGTKPGTPAAEHLGFSGEAPGARGFRGSPAGAKACARGVGLSVRGKTPRGQGKKPCERGIRPRGRSSAPPDRPHGPRPRDPEGAPRPRRRARGALRGPGDGRALAGAPAAGAGGIPADAGTRERLPCPSLSSAMSACGS